VHEIDDALHGERGGLGGRIADEAPAFALVEREREITLGRLREGRADFFGDTYEVSDADKAQFAKHMDRVADQFLNGNCFVVVAAPIGVDQ